MSKKSEIKVVGISASDAAKRIQKVKEKIENDGFLDVAFVFNGTHVRLSFFNCQKFQYLLIDCLQGDEVYFETLKRLDSSEINKDSFKIENSFSSTSATLSFSTPMIFNGVW